MQFTMDEWKFETGRDVGPVGDFLDL